MILVFLCETFGRTINIMTKLMWLFAAGGLGTLARYWLGGFVQRLCGSEFPFGTIVVNLVGCLAFGFVWTLAEERLIISGEMRFIILVGFMGAFTTFSTFAFETSGMLSDAEWRYAAGNFLGHNVGGVAAVIGGMALGKLL